MIKNKTKQHCSIAALLSSRALHLSRCHPNKARAAPSARGSESRAERSERGGRDRRQGSAGRSGEEVQEEEELQEGSDGKWAGEMGNSESEGSLLKGVGTAAAGREVEKNMQQEVSSHPARRTILMVMKTDTKQNCLVLFP